MVFSNETINIIQTAEQKLAAQFEKVGAVAYKNQMKVLSAFQSLGVAERHFSGTTGYGYDDIGRDTLNLLYASIFGAEKAIVSPYFASGTHALTVMLFGVLRPGDVCLSITGKPYDTLHSLIDGEGGSLKDFGIKFDFLPLKSDGGFDDEKIESYLASKAVKAIFIQRSRGYEWRNALTPDDIGNLVKKIKKISPKTVILVDNCYGEFVEELEPTDVGADLMAGSLIKNAGGGFAPTGGYIAGRADLVDLAAYRLTVPSIGTEVGSYAFGYTAFYQGAFMAPTVVAAALKGSMLWGQTFVDMGYQTLPLPNDKCGDIIRSIMFDTEDELVAFCRGVQHASPVDSNVTLEPWDMPGYNHQVIMAAGSFIQGSSIELSADSPIKAPYIAYVQGGLTYEHVKIAVHSAVENIIHSKNYVQKTRKNADILTKFGLRPIAELVAIMSKNETAISEKQYEAARAELIEHCVRSRYDLTIESAERLFTNCITNRMSIEQTARFILGIPEDKPL